MNKDDFKHISYNPDTGLFFSITNIEKPIGCSNKGGYVVFRINQKIYYAHRVAYFLIHGELPKVIDHINGIRSDNRIQNLRPATHQTNCHNRKASGVTTPKQTKKFAAAITVNRKRKHIGYFNSREEAHQAYLAAKKILHPTSPEHLFVV